jgi:hypothetical protein
MSAGASRALVSCADRALRLADCRLREIQTELYHAALFSLVGEMQLASLWLTGTGVVLSKLTIPSPVLDCSHWMNPLAALCCLLAATTCFAAGWVPVPSLLPDGRPGEVVYVPQNTTLAVALNNSMVTMIVLTSNYSVGEQFAGLRDGAAVLNISRQVWLMLQCKEGCSPACCSEAAHSHKQCMATGKQQQRMPVHRRPCLPPLDCRSLGGRLLEVYGGAAA